MKFNPSNDPVVEKAQHDPHCPWFFTPVTAPFVLQSTVVGGSISPPGKNEVSTGVISSSVD